MSKRLLRSRTDTVVGGVAAGLASYLNADPALVRIGWAILIPLTGGAALLAYIVAWIVVPEEPKADASAREAAASEVQAATAVPGESVTEPARGGDSRAGLVVGIGLILIGLWFLLRPYLPDLNWNLVWPVVIVAIGVLILATALRRSS